MLGDPLALSCVCVAIGGQSTSANGVKEQPHSERHYEKLDGSFGSPWFSDASQTVKFLVSW